MFRVLGLAFLLIDVAFIAFAYFGTITLSGSTCQPYLDRLTQNNHIFIRFESISFNIRKMKLNDLQIKIEQQPLLTSNQFLIQYRFSQLIKGHWANLLIKAEQTKVVPPSAALMDISQLQISDWTLDLRGKIRYNQGRGQWIGEGDLFMNDVHADSPSLFLKKLGQFLRLASFESLMAQKITLKFANDGVELNIPEVTAESDDYNLKGVARYEWGKEVQSAFVLTYNSYIPGREETEGPNQLKFSVYGPLSSPGYRIS